MKHGQLHAGDRETRVSTRLYGRFMGGCLEGISGKIP